MEGRRVTRKNQKYNPLFILFLCLVAAVIILLIVSIVLGARLGSAGKKLKASEVQIQELTETVNQLNTDLAAAKDRLPAAEPSNSNQPSIPGSEPVDSSGSGSAATSDGFWLDLSGHDEVKVKPTTLLDGYATYYTTAGVNLRSGPATNYDRITTVDYGEAVQVAARDGGWSFAKVGTKFGWISSDYLSATEPTSSSGQRTEATSGSIRR